MSKVRVRALKQGFDGSRRRNPGDEFDFDVERYGHGTWFEVLEGGDGTVDREPSAPKKSRAKKKAKRARKPKDTDDRLV